MCTSRTSQKNKSETLTRITGIYVQLDF
jgi:hypothetical protein